MNLFSDLCYFFTCSCLLKWYYLGIDYYLYFDMYFYQTFWLFLLQHKLLFFNTYTVTKQTLVHMLLNKNIITFSVKYAYVLSPPEKKEKYVQNLQNVLVNSILSHLYWDSSFSRTNVRILSFIHFDTVWPVCCSSAHRHVKLKSTCGLHCEVFYKAGRSLENFSFETPTLLINMSILNEVLKILPICNNIVLIKVLFGPQLNCNGSCE